MYAMQRNRKGERDRFSSWEIEDGAQHTFSMDFGSPFDGRL